MSGEKKKCGELTYKAKDQDGLNRVEIDSNLWRFVSTWIRRFRHKEFDRPDQHFERFIFLWVSVNAWASMAVPNQSRNHEDAYLVQSMARDPGLNAHFDNLLENHRFHADVTAFAELGPVFQVLWLRNKNIPAWHKDEGESRRDYVTRVFSLDPFHRIPARRQGEQAQVFPAFAPACAWTHISTGQPIPADWPHLLSMIYQVRCNLFHGGKTYESSADQEFVDYAFKILWRVWRNVVPFEDQAGLMPWERLFVRSGVRCHDKGDEIDLSDESERNRAFVRTVLDAIGWGHRLTESTFRKPPELIEEQEWLDAWESLHRGAEGGATGFDNIELEIMDTHLSGVVRWLNGLGYITGGISCEGHGKRKCFIELASAADEPRVADLIANVSRGIRFQGRTLTKIDPSGRKPEANPSPRDLLDLGENLHRLMRNKTRPARQTGVEEEDDADY